MTAQKGASTRPKARNWPSTTRPPPRSLRQWAALRATPPLAPSTSGTAVTPPGTSASTPVVPFMAPPAAGPAPCGRGPATSLPPSPNPRPAPWAPKAVGKSLTSRPSPATPMASSAHPDCAEGAGTGWASAGPASRSPSWGAAVLLSDEFCSTKIGFLNPLLYSEPSSLVGPITSGDNDLSGSHHDMYETSASGGYSMAGGLGYLGGADLSSGALCGPNSGAGGGGTGTSNPGGTGSSLPTTTTTSPPTTARAQRARGRLRPSSAWFPSTNPCRASPPPWPQRWMATIAPGTS